MRTFDFKLITTTLNYSWCHLEGLLYSYYFTVSGLTLTVPPIVWCTPDIGHLDPVKKCSFSTEKSLIINNERGSVVHSHYVPKILFFFNLMLKSFTVCF